MLNVSRILLEVLVIDWHPEFSNPSPEIDVSIRNVSLLYHILSVGIPIKKYIICAGCLFQLSTGWTPEEPSTLPFKKKNKKKMAKWEPVWKCCSDWTGLGVQGKFRRQLSGRLQTAQLSLWMPPMAALWYQGHLTVLALVQTDLLKFNETCCLL